MVTCCYNKDNDLVVQVFNRMDQKHFMFVYSWKDKQIASEIKSIDLKNATKSNFPIKSFYSNVHDEIYTFYRQGNCVT